MRSPKHGLSTGLYAATTWVPMRAQIPTVPSNDNTHPGGYRRVSQHTKFLNFFKVPLDNLKTNNFGAFTGPVAQA